MAELLKLLSIKMDLHNVLYVSYLVPVDRIRPLVPSELTLASTNDKVFISIVAMRCRRVHLSGLRWPSFSYDQLNLRTYVADPETGKPAVYFFKSGVSSKLINTATSILGIPWERISFSLFTERSDTGATYYRAAGNWNGEIEILMKSPVVEDLSKTVIEHITGPMAGFIGSDKRLKRIAIEHKVLDVRALSLLRIRFNLPVEAGLLITSELDKPDSVLIVPESRFTVFI